MTAQVLDGEQVLLHAREIFRCSGDLLGGEAELRESRLAVTTSNEYLNLCCPVASDRWDAFALRQTAKIGSRLGRIPFPHIASLVFNGRLRVGAGSFRISPSTVLGSPPCGELSKNSVPAARPAPARRSHHRQAVSSLSCSSTGCSARPRSLRQSPTRIRPSGTAR